MKAKIFCEGTTDLLMIQFVLQYKYGWKYSGFVENTITNRLIRRRLVRENDVVEIDSCGGMMNIPNKMSELKDVLELATHKTELFDKVIVMVDHDTITSNQEFLKILNEKLNAEFQESQINAVTEWYIYNAILGEVKVELLIRCLPEKDTGAIETIMLEALNTDDVENELINESGNFINQIANQQHRYLQKKSRIAKAIFNTYFAIRTPEEKYDERARILKAYDWNNNEVLNDEFRFLDL